MDTIIISDLRGKEFSLSLLSLMLALDFFIRIFILFLAFEGFCHEWALDFVKCFFHIGIIMQFLFFHLFILCVTLTNLKIFKQPCISGIMPFAYDIYNPFQCVAAFNLLLTDFVSVFVRDFFFV